MAVPLSKVDDRDTRKALALDAVNQHAAELFGCGPYVMPNGTNQVNAANVSLQARMLIADLMLLVDACGWNADEAVRVDREERARRAP
jgi:hypothetical protein